MTDIKVDINWKLILPQKGFLELFLTPFAPESLSSTIIYIICTIFFITLFYLIYRLILSNNSISFFLSILSKADPDHLAEQRRDLLNNSLKKKYEGSLWSEFNETLVESTDGKRLYNTIDAINFFNSSTLARGVTESRLMSAIPGILTAIGVLGTFLGLQFGLGSLQLDPESLQHAGKSIAPLIKGAAIAFSTSVWGIMTSVLFNVTEKLIEHHLQNRINTLQNRIDQLFPRVIAEQALLEIQHHGKESEDTLKGLAEQIGNRMQHAMLNFSDKFQEDFKETINPAINNLIKATDDLTNRQQSGTAEILTKLIEEFISSVGSVGDEQRKNLESASSSVQNGVEQLSNSMDQFMGQLKGQLKVWQSQEAERNQQVDSKIAQLQEGWNKSTQVFLARLQRTLEKLEEQDSQKAEIMDKQINQMGLDWSSTLSKFVAQIEEQMSSWTTNADQLAISVESQLSSGQSIVKQGHALADRADQSQKVIEILSEDIATAAELMESATVNLSNFGDKIGESAVSMGGSILEASNLSLSASKKNQEVVDKFNNAVGLLLQLKEELTHVAEYFYQSATTSKEIFVGMEKTQENFLSGLGENLKDLQEQVAKLMHDYAISVEGQTIERMQIWNEQTKNFSDTLKDSIATMNDIVSEIYDKLDHVTN
jgi:hypothetical protein